MKIFTPEELLDRYSDHFYCLTNEKDCHTDITGLNTFIPYQSYNPTFFMSVNYLYTVSNITIAYEKYHLRKTV